jgi:GNAT superfamily N-acetyltransferase
MEVAAVRTFRAITYHFKSRIEKALIDQLQVIEMLSTHPEHQRRGAGTMLMEWGTDIADSLGLRAFVQAGRVGAKHLYGSHGFVDKYKEGFINVPVSEKHKNKPEVGWFNLERPAKAAKFPEAKEGV